MSGGGGGIQCNLPSARGPTRAVDGPHSNTVSRERFNAFFRGEYTFFNMAVTESDLHTKVTPGQKKYYNISTTWQKTSRACLNVGEMPLIQMDLLSTRLVTIKS